MLALMVLSWSVLTACDNSKKPEPTAAQRAETKAEVAPVVTKPAEHFRGKDGPASTGGPPTTTTNGQ